MVLHATVLCPFDVTWGCVVLKGDATCEWPAGWRTGDGRAKRKQFSFFSFSSVSKTDVQNSGVVCKSPCVVVHTSLLCNTIENYIYMFFVTLDLSFLVPLRVGWRLHVMSLLFDVTSLPEAATPPSVLRHYQREHHGEVIVSSLEHRLVVAKL